MKIYRIALLMLALSVVSCQEKDWEWSVDGLGKDYRTDDFGDRVTVEYLSKTKEWTFYSAYSIYGPFYYGIAQGIQDNASGNTRYGSYEFPGRFYIYLVENRPSNIRNHSAADEWAELRKVEWIDDESIQITYIVQGERKTCYLHGGIKKNQ